MNFSNFSKHCKNYFVALALSLFLFGGFISPNTNDPGSPCESSAVCLIDLGGGNGGSAKR